MRIGEMEFREDKRKYRRNGLEDECKGKDGEIDSDEDHPTVIFILFWFSNQKIFSHKFYKTQKAKRLAQSELIY